MTRHSISNWLETDHKILSAIIQRTHQDLFFSSFNDETCMISQDSCDSGCERANQMAFFFVMMIKQHQATQLISSQ